MNQNTIVIVRPSYSLSFASRCFIDISSWISSIFIDMTIKKPNETRNMTSSLTLSSRKMLSGIIRNNISIPEITWKLLRLFWNFENGRRVAVRTQFNGSGTKIECVRKLSDDIPLNRRYSLSLNKITEVQDCDLLLNSKTSLIMTSTPRFTWWVTWASCQIRKLRRECRERFPRHGGFTIPTCFTARAWRTCRDACRDR